jgi:hypothetical protein
VKIFGIRVPLNALEPPGFPIRIPAIFTTGGQRVLQAELGVTLQKILMAKSEIHPTHVWQAVENRECQGPGRRENDFAISIKNDTDGEVSFAGICPLTTLAFRLVPNVNHAYCGLRQQYQK